MDTKRKSIKEFSTHGMKYHEVEELFKKVEPIPIGEVVYEDEGFMGGVKKLIVDKDNQKLITMCWNAVFFDNYKDAKRSNDIAVAEYFDWLYSYI